MTSKPCAICRIPANGIVGIRETSGTVREWILCPNHMSTDTEVLEAIPTDRVFFMPGVDQ